VLLARHARRERVAHRRSGSEQIGRVEQQPT
jgi:hypothetical protein